MWSLSLSAGQLHPPLTCDQIPARSLSCPSSCNLPHCSLRKKGTQIAAFPPSPVLLGEIKSAELSCGCLGSKPSNAPITGSINLRERKLQKARREESGGHKLSSVVGNKSRAPADASWEIRPLPLQMELTATTNVAAVALL